LLRRAEEIVIEAKERLMDENIHPLSIIHAFFFTGIGPVAISHLDNEEKLMVCRMLEGFIADTKEVMTAWRN
jgi:hypothetical protein